RRTKVLQKRKLFFLLFGKLNRPCFTEIIQHLHSVILPGHAKEYPAFSIHCNLDEVPFRNFRVRSRGRRGNRYNFFRPELGYQNKEGRSEEHTSELQSRENLVCRLL